MKKKKKLKKKKKKIKKKKKKIKKNISKKIFQKKIVKLKGYRAGKSIPALGRGMDFPAFFKKIFFFIFFFEFVGFFMHFDAKIGSL